MPPKKSKLRLGEGARCRALLTKIRPSQEIDKHFPNKEARATLDDLIATRFGIHKRRGDSFPAVWFTSATLPGIELVVAKRFVHVLAEGPSDRLFEELALPPSSPGTVEDTVEEVIFHATGDLREDIAAARAAGLTVDDDNEPAPENIPAPNLRHELDPNTGLNEGQSWGWNGICYRKTMTLMKEKATFHHNWKPNSKSFLEVFLHWLPMKWIADTIIDATNESLKASKEAETCMGEFLVFVGLWFLMNTVIGFSRREYFSSREYNEETFACPYRLAKYMSGRRFELILSHLRFTKEKPPSFVDRFWEVREMLQEWQKHINEIFIPSWVSCLDESMSIWTNKYTCPGFVFCPRKPKDKGNEYHTICCGLTGIMFGWEIVEGKDRPRHLGKPEFEEQLGKTAGLLMRLCKPIFHTSKYIVLDSGFCVLSALIALKKVGVFAGSLIKKRRYWPLHCRGDAIDTHFNGLDVGSVDAVKGKLDDEDYNIFCMKEPDYVCKIFGTAGGLITVDEREHRRVWTKDGQDQSVSFKYTEPFYLHFRYRHAVDDHNNLRHQVPSLEETWTTRRWACRVFAFLLAVTEVNAYLTVRYFVWSEEEMMTLVEFRRQLAWALIKNPEWVGEQEELRRSKRHRLTRVHSLATAPLFCKRWTGTEWDTTAKTKYGQFTCSDPRCKTKIRTYCVCNPGKWICKDHWADHYSNALLEQV